MEKVTATCQFCQTGVAVPPNTNPHCPNCNAENLFFGSYAELLRHSKVTVNKTANSSKGGPKVENESGKSKNNGKPLLPPFAKKALQWTISLAMLFAFVKPFFTESPESVVEEFLENLADKPLTSALLMAHKSTEDARAFIRNDKYGGVASVKVIEMKEINSDDREFNKVLAIYEANDPINNGLRRYKQIFWLHPENNKIKICAIDNIEVSEL
jgi:hypothetical protein